MAKPIWQTYYNLGTFENNTVIKIPLVANAVPPAIAVSYSLAAGALPPGLDLSIDGTLFGTVVTTFTNNVFTFTVQALDNLGNISLRTFQISAVITPQPPNWVTPQGSIGQYTENSTLLFQKMLFPLKSKVHLIMLL